MQTLWQYFRISLALVATSVIFGLLAYVGVDELEKRRPPVPIVLNKLDAAWSEYRFRIRAAGPYRFDLELDVQDSTPQRLCSHLPAATASDCMVPAGRIGIEWQVAPDNGEVAVSGNLKTSGSRMYFGSFHWLELGAANMKTGAYRLRIRDRVVASNMSGTEFPWARVRIWRGSRDDAEAHEAARRTSNWMFATLCLLVLSVFSVMLEYAVWKRQRAAR